MTILSNKIVPTHYQVASATGDAITAEALKLISDLDDVRNLAHLEESTAKFSPPKWAQLDTVAEIQEAEQWDDYRPVGSRFFVGRGEVRHKLYGFLQSAQTFSGGRRIFFIERKSGWGKSSLIAELRARSRNKRNKNWLYVLAIDSRSANTGAFVGLAFAKLVSSASKSGFVPPQFAQVNVASTFDTLASEEVKSLLEWLQEHRKVLVLVFDQFEDMFRKSDLFQAFHKFMMDVNGEAGNLFVGFSWKSEINVPIDNPAYSLWQQTRDLAEPFGLDEFLGSEVDLVLRQLEEVSHHQLPADLRRKLKESSQGFPWLTKRLSIHCYHQMQKGISPEELVDQNLNVDVLMQEDMEALTPEEARALNLVARRGYEGDPFDIAEVDEKIGGQEIHSLLNKRLIVRSGGKYNVYWDIFRDFLMEGKVPTIGESFLLRQFPKPCEKTLELLLPRRSATLADILTLSPGLTEGTALNRLRELRYLGAITKVQEQYTVRPTLRSLEEFRAFMRDRLREHVVARTLKRFVGDSISHEDVVEALKATFKGFGFGNKTWKTYASYFVAWFRFAGIDFGRKLRFQSRGVSGVSGFIPQRRPEKDCEIFFLFRDNQTVARSKSLDRHFYDLRAIGLIEYDGANATLTKRGSNLLKLDDLAAKKEIAQFALTLPKVQQAHDALLRSRDGQGDMLDEHMRPILSEIPSSSYREVAGNVLKSWALMSRFWGA